MFAPAEQDLGDFGETPPRREIAQPQVVVFGPAVFAVAPQVEDFLSSHHGRRVGQWTFDEDFAGDIIVVHQLVEPIFVDAEPRAYIFPGKSFDE